MKKILLVFVAFSLMSCGSGYLANKMEREFKGDWVLTEVSFPNSSGFFDVSLFNLGEVSCFENSEWSFVSNNNTGEFQLFGNDCIRETQEFAWSIDPTTIESNVQEMVFKITTDQNARKVTQGSRIRIKSLLANTMIWEQSVNFEGDPINIQMEFKRQVNQ
ncbi:lipocalin family protein [Psychroflexus aestuariivivens]|uniref:lipocalin family protein n=1 Tax=Psychroflexus aestuariivivens TaxID=1795040 RepID=UPI000FD76FC6|nr:lipocalin family protein [Psychroflexus aestuariivivens]